MPFLGFELATGPHVAGQALSDVWPTQGSDAFIAFLRFARLFNEPRAIVPLCQHRTPVHKAV